MYRIHIVSNTETKKILMGTPPSKKSSSSESIYDNHHPIVPSGWIDSIRDSLPTTRKSIEVNMFYDTL